MILSDDVSDDDSIDDGTEWNGDNVERREGDSESAAGDDHCCNIVDATDSCVHWTGQDAVGWSKVESSIHFRRKWQNIPTKLPGVIGQSKLNHYVLEAQIHLITDANLGNIIHRTNQCMLII